MFRRSGRRHRRGFGVATIAHEGYTREYVGLDVDGFDPWEPTGVLHMSAVAEDRTGEGIATKLMKARLRYLVARGARGAFGISWHRDDAPDSRPLFEKFGFEQLGPLERYYSRTAGRPRCPDCDGECECTASVYVTEYDNE